MSKRLDFFLSVALVLIAGFVMAVIYAAIWVLFLLFDGPSTQDKFRADCAEREGLYSYSGGRGGDDYCIKNGLIVQVYMYG